MQELPLPIPAEQVSSQMPKLVKAFVKYKIIKSQGYSTHSWLLTMSDYYAGKTESAVLHHLHRRHGKETNIVVNSIDWR